MVRVVSEKEAHSGPLYRVRGHFIWRQVDHDQRLLRDGTAEIDRIVRAMDEQTAEYLATRDLWPDLLEVTTISHWANADEPLIEEVEPGEDVKMRALGVPELFPTV